MQVILLEKVRNLGNLGDWIHVMGGYGRNFLIPQNKAVFATPFENERLIPNIDDQGNITSTLVLLNNV